MSGQIASNSTSFELVVLIVGASMLIGAIDLIRQPGAAWKQADESKIAYLILVLLLPLIGLAMYVFRARPKVVALVVAGQATGMPFELSEGEPEHEPQEESQPVGSANATFGFGSFGEVAALSEHPPTLESTSTMSSAPSQVAEVSSTFFSSGASHSIRHQLTLPRPYRPKQRTHLSTVEEAAPVAPAIEEAASVLPAIEEAAEVAPAIEEAAPVVPAAWMADPTERHEYRYWDGSCWTENVADAGRQSRDPAST